VKRAKEYADSKSTQDVSNQEIANVLNNKLDKGCNK
jgi:hypothetical protein